MLDSVYFHPGHKPPTLVTHLDLRQLGLLQNKVLSRVTNPDSLKESARFISLLYCKAAMAQQVVSRFGLNLVLVLVFGVGVRVGVSVQWLVNETPTPTRTSNIEHLQYTNTGLNPKLESTYYVTLLYTCRSWMHHISNIVKCFEYWPCHLFSVAMEAASSL